MQKRGHLVDKGARAASAGAVHALLDAVIEVDDLGILAAQLNSDVGSGDERLDGALAGDDFLHELEAQPLGKQQAARAGDGAGHLSLGQQARSAHEQVARAGTHIGMVALILGVDNLVLVVQHGKLDGGRAHVDAQMQLASRGLGIVDGTSGTTPGRISLVSSFTSFIGYSLSLRSSVSSS